METNLMVKPKKIIRIGNKGENDAMLIAGKEKELKHINSKLVKIDTEIARKYSLIKKINVFLSKKIQIPVLGISAVTLLTNLGLSFGLTCSAIAIGSLLTADFVALFVRENEKQEIKNLRIDKSCELWKQKDCTEAIERHKNELQSTLSNEEREESKDVSFYQPFFEEMLESEESYSFEQSNKNNNLENRPKQYIRRLNVKIKNN